MRAATSTVESDGEASPRAPPKVLAAVRASFAALPPLRLDTLDLDAPLQLGPQDKLSHGVLGNGLSFYVRSNAKPAARAALALVVRVGSLAETEAERGVAHFLEHLAFNATELFTHHALVAFLEASGLPFGACQNAYTSCDETCFELLLPTDTPGLLQKALSILAQFAHRIRVSPEDVAAERGAILEEWRGGRDARGRAAEAAWRLTYAGSAYAERLPIGLESVIRGVSADTVRGFYGRWYRPQNMALVAVGDWSEDERAGVVAAIAEAFGGVAPPEGAAPQAPPMPVALPAAHSTPRAACHAEPALTESSVMVTYTMPRTPLASARDIRRHICGELFEACLSARLFRASRGASPLWYSAAAQLDAPLATVDSVVLSAVVPVGGILPALRALLAQLASVRAHGFGAAELRRARARLAADIEQAWVERDQAYSTAVRDEYVRHFLSAEAVLDADTEARLGLAAVRDIRDDEVAAVASTLTLDCSCVVRAACGAAERRPPSEAELLAVLREAAAAEAAGDVPPPDAASDAPLELLAPLPEVTDAAAIVARAEWPAVGASELRLRNGMRVCVKRTPFLDDQVLISAVARGGLSELPPASGRSAAAAAAGLLAGEAGVFGHRPEELDDILAGRRCSISATLGAFRREFGGDASPADLDAALAMCHLLFVTTPSAPDELLAVPLRLARENIRSQANNPSWLFTTAVKRLNYGSCYYLEPMSEKTLDTVRPSDALDVFARAFSNPAEFAVCLVGALPENADELEALVMQYLGTIPAASSPPPRAPADITPLPWRFPAAPTRREVRARMPEPQAAAQLTWPLVLLGGGSAAAAAAAAADPRSEASLVMEQRLWAHLGCRVLESRLLKLMRFRFGDVYSVSVSPFFGMEAPSASLPLRGDCAVSFSCDPSAAWRLVELALDELALLQQSGPTAEDCATAAELERRAHELSEAENDFWLQRMVAAYQSKRFDGDVDAFCAAQDGARAAVLGALSPDTLRGVFYTTWPHPSRSRYTAVALLPRRTLLERAAAAHAAAHAAWADAGPAARGSVVLAAGAAAALAAALAYARWRSWRRD